MTRRDFFLELRTEEIPAAAIGSARTDLARRLEEALAAEGLAAERTESWATPRRLAVALRGVPSAQEDRDSEVLGPPASAAYDAQGKPTRAAEGFARAQKAEVSDLVVVESPRGPTVAVRRRIPGRPAGEVLAEVVPRIVRDMTFPKTMRWGEGRRSFVRPLRGVVALLGGEVVAMEVLGVAAGNQTVGHRVLSEGSLTVLGPEHWLEKLRAAGVEPDGERRRMQLLEKARSLAAAVNGSIESDSDLAATLADLVEWPGAVRGSYSGEFLELPEEITVTAMRTHQKYLPIRGPGGLLPHFVAVMDNKEDARGFISKGNEWVLNARLADARFFYREDTKVSLESRLEQLSRLAVHERLGDYRAKTERLVELSESIAHIVGRPDLVEVVRGAARLCKLDLPTNMVKEFPDLQGIVGGIYARREGYPDSVWRAVYDHYRPVSSGDDPPREAAGSVLGLADRFDTLAGFFSIGLVPTGSKDPYGLRRCAAGLVGIALSRNWRLDWRPVARKAIGLYPPAVTARPAEEILEEISRFLAERVRGLLERRSHSHDEISAVLRTGVWDFADAADRVSALADARRQMDFRSLILAFKRIRNIVGEGAARSAPVPELYKEDAEKALAADFLQVRRAIEGLYGTRRYREAMEMIASLAPSLDRFFVDVLVNAPEEDLRNNRHALLASIQKEFSRLADFSEIVVEK
ncbi:MAG TPA: glycine--tRNA ligase subunit beta [Thermoanaerobaculia bacterium]|jgi:glycyl-tRNA synthetase beta chain